MWFSDEDDQSTLLLLSQTTCLLVCFCSHIHEIVIVTKFVSSYWTTNTDVLVCSITASETDGWKIFCHLPRVRLPTMMSWAECHLLTRGIVSLGSPWATCNVSVILRGASSGVILSLSSFNLFKASLRSRKKAPMRGSIFLPASVASSSAQ